ncbi:MAG: hypothetical protein JKX68_00565 [Flavobacteriales bacterium]|nr:hypothetical protein [Flavobacteriales bacterium]
MKKFLLIFVIAISFNSFGQDSTEAKPSKFSLGASPITSFYIAEEEKGMQFGFGAELNLDYKFNNYLSVGAFFRYSNIMNALHPIFNQCGTEGSLCERTFEVFSAAGLLVEYKAFDRFGFHIRVGKEHLSAPSKTNYIYGGGVSFYLPPTKSRKFVHSFNFVAYQSNNLAFPEWRRDPINGSVDQVTIFYDAIIYQLGWRIQFHGLKPKN